MNQSVLLAYSNQDGCIADFLARFLEERGNNVMPFAERELPHGTDRRLLLTDILTRFDAVIIIDSAGSEKTPALLELAKIAGSQNKIVFQFRSPHDVGSRLPAEGDGHPLQDPAEFGVSQDDREWFERCFRSHNGAEGVSSVPTTELMPMPCLMRPLNGSGSSGPHEDREADKRCFCRENTKRGDDPKIIRRLGRMFDLLDASAKCDAACSQLIEKDKDSRHSPSGGVCCASAGGMWGSLLASIAGRVFGAPSPKETMYSSVFAPSGIEPGTHLLIQVFFHSDSDEEAAARSAAEAQPESIRREHVMISDKIGKGDSVDVLLNISGDKLLFSSKKTFVWNELLEKCTFVYLVPPDISSKDLLCEVFLQVNGAPIGEMTFVTRIVAETQVRPAALTTKRYEKVFISYAHQDEAQVLPVAKSLKKLGADVFFDRDYLDGGDVFPEIISDFIKSADLFILCWSENASSSSYVRKERELALSLAYPQIKPREEAHLSIFPMNIPPKAELPDDMRDIYNFEDIGKKSV